MLKTTCKCVKKEKPGWTVKLNNRTSYTCSSGRWKCIAQCTNSKCIYQNSFSCLHCKYATKTRLKQWPSDIQYQLTLSRKRWADQGRLIKILRYRCISISTTGNVVILTPSFKWLAIFPSNIVVFVLIAGSSSTCEAYRIIKTQNKQIIMTRNDYAPLSNILKKKSISTASWYTSLM